MAAQTAHLGPSVFWGRKPLELQGCVHPVKNTKYTILEWKGILRPESPCGKTIYVCVLYLVYHGSLFCKLDSGILYICCGILNPCAPSFDGVLAYNLCKSRSATGKHNTHRPRLRLPQQPQIDAGKSVSFPVSGSFFH